MAKENHSQDDATSIENLSLSLRNREVKLSRGERINNEKKKRMRVDRDTASERQRRRKQVLMHYFPASHGIARPRTGRRGVAPLPTVALAIIL